MPQSHYNSQCGDLLILRLFINACGEHTPRNMRVLRVYSTVPFNELTFHFAGNSTYLSVLICFRANFSEKICKVYLFRAVGDSLHIRCYTTLLYAVKYPLLWSMEIIHIHMCGASACAPVYSYMISCVWTRVWSYTCQLAGVNLFAYIFAANLYTVPYWRLYFRFHAQCFKLSKRLQILSILNTHFF